MGWRNRDVWGLVLLATVWACASETVVGDETTGDAGGAGGASGSGGASGAGGTSGAGGASGAGGSRGSSDSGGGAGAPDQGGSGGTAGASGVGGVDATGGMGGTSGNGATGGATAAGGGAGTAGSSGSGATSDGGTGPVEPWYPCGPDSDVPPELPQTECAAVDDSECDLKLRALEERATFGDDVKTAATYYYYDTQGRLACVHTDYRVFYFTYEGDRVIRTAERTICPGDPEPCYDCDRWDARDAVTGILRESFDECEGGDWREYDEVGRLTSRGDSLRRGEYFYAYTFLPDGRVDVVTVSDSVGGEAVGFLRHEYVDTDESTTEYIYYEDVETASAPELRDILVFDVLGNRVLEYDPVYGELYNTGCDDDPPACDFYVYHEHDLLITSRVHSTYARVAGASFQQPSDPDPDEVADMYVAMAEGLEFSKSYSFDGGRLSRIDFEWSTDMSASVLYRRCDRSVGEVTVGGLGTEVTGWSDKTFYYGCASDPTPVLSCLERCEP